MSRKIAVLGATGSQGGSVVRILLESKQWKVRAITRNPSSDKGKEIASLGCEVVSANNDDESSLAKAFEGVQAVFALTNFWEHLFTGSSRDESGQKEQVQAMKIARAAAKTPTLEHYIWSTLPSATKLTNGKVLCAHTDYKAEVDEKIKAELPNLAKKTTYLTVGWYPQNMVGFPLCKPVLVPAAGKYIWPQPARPDSLIPVSGDITQTPGVFVRQILANPTKTYGKYVSCRTETISWTAVLAIWSEVTGKPATCVETTADSFEAVWGPGGRELGDQLAFGNVCDDWTAGQPKNLWVGTDELGITPGELNGLKQTLEIIKDGLL